MGIRDAIAWAKAKQQENQDRIAREGARAMGPEQAFDEDVVYAQDPDKAKFLLNPYGKDPSATQEATQAMRQNVSIAQEGLAEQPGEEAYTLNPTLYQPMGWDPSEAYRYETAQQQARSGDEGLEAQRQALGGFQDIANQGGLTAIDRAAIMQSQMQREQELRANQEAVLRDAAEQGRSGGMLSYLQRGQAAQGTANMRALDDARMQATALGRKDQALGAAADIGGSMQSAQDAIDRFNTGLRADVQTRNADQFNRGVDTRYDDERTAQNANVDTANKFEQLNKSNSYGARGRWADRQDARAGVMDQLTNKANYFTGKQAGIEAKRQQRFNNVMTGVSAVAGPLASVGKRFTEKDDEE